MAIPPGVCRFSLTGNLGSSEEFNTSFWTLGGGDSLSTLQGLATDIATWLNATGNWGTVQSLLFNGDSYDVLRAYSYPNGGPDATWSAEADLSLVGSAASGGLPLQTCLVASLRTNQVGRSRRGRMYLPCTAPAMPHGQLDAATTQDVADEVAALFEHVNSYALPGGGNPSVVVVSQTLTDSDVVVRVLVDSLADIQRRRANKAVPSTTAVGTVIP